MNILQTPEKIDRIGFLNFTSNLWKAGEVYQKNLFSALKDLDYGTKIEISLFSYRDNDGVSPLLLPYLSQELPLPDINTVPGQKKGFSQKLINALRSRVLDKTIFFSPGYRISRYLKNHSVDIFFSTMNYGPYFNIPYLCWIADFQSFHYPEMFSPEIIKERLDHYEKIAKYSDRIILSGEFARNDFRQQYPYAEDKLRVLSFVASVPESVYRIDPYEICLKYNLPEKFFYLPNQIWKHKNHRVVLEALNLIKNEISDVVIVLSGMPYDGRHPNHFAELLTTISEFGIRNQVIFLGVIPYEDVLSLARQSLAVIQPSLFEGWSTTVEEVKSLGKSIILSDIPVHRDQNPPNSFYFDPHDPQQLAYILKKMYIEKQSGPDYFLEEEARKLMPARLRVYGQTFLDIVHELI